MKKLTKAQLAKREEIVAKLRETYEELAGAVETFNEAMSNAWDEVVEAVDKYNVALDNAWGGENGFEQKLNDYNSAVDDANNWKQEVAGDIQAYMDERSEKWQESEAAERYSAWREGFDEETPTADIDRPEDLVVERPDDLENDVDDDAADLLEQLPEELEG